MSLVSSRSYTRIYSGSILGGAVLRRRRAPAGVLCEERRDPRLASGLSQRAHPCGRLRPRRDRGLRGHPVLLERR